MKKNRLMLSILALMFLLLPMGVFAMDYQHELKVKNMQFSWTIEGDQIHVQLSAKTTGWVAIGFDPETAMQGANIIIGLAKDGKFQVEDHYGDRKRGHASDKKLGGTDDVLNASGAEIDGVTTMRFTLSLKSEDKYDKAIQPKGTSRIMLAYGAGKDSFNNRHPYRTVYDVDFATGKSKKIK